MSDITVVSSLSHDLLAAVFQYLDYDSLLECQLTSKAASWQTAVRASEDGVYERSMRAREWEAVARERKDVGYRQGVTQWDEDQGELQRGFNEGFLDVVPATMQNAVLHGYLAAAAMFATEHANLLENEQQSIVLSNFATACKRAPDLPIPLVIPLSDNKTSPVEQNEEKEETKTLRERCEESGKAFGVTFSSSTSVPTTTNDNDDEEFFM